MNDPLISVIVPTYNRAYCICRTIDSVREQTHRNWEVVLVDDGSTDDTAAIIASRYSDDPRVRYLYQPNGGVSAARNAGIRAAHGDYVSFLDSDDIWEPWKLEVQLACFRTFPEVGMVWTNFEAVDAAGTVVKRRYLTTMYEAYRHFESFESLFEKSCALSDVLDSESGFEAGARVYVGNIYTPMLRGNLVHTSSVILSHERIAKVKGFDESLALSGEDYDFHFRTCKWGSVCFVDVPSTIYQLGFEDRLTQHKKAIAQNFLRTVQNAIARESVNTTFPPAMVDEVLAEAHAWIAEELLKIKDYPGVRKHALLGLRRRIWQPRLVSVLGIALVPPFLSELLLRIYRNCKSLIAGTKRS
jgi:glycosyltransferase involved in cell wall biosynthesis